MNQPAARATGLAHARPYDCRHTYVSLRIHQGDNAVEIAHNVGHAPTMTFDTYAHVIHAYRSHERRPMAQLIVEARAALDAHGHDLDAIKPLAALSTPERHEIPAEARIPKERLKGLEPSTFCMASRRSSQLSYSRMASGGQRIDWAGCSSSPSRDAGRPLGGIIPR